MTTTKNTTSKLTVKALAEQVAANQAATDAQIGKLTELVAALVNAQGSKPTKPEQPKRDWLSPFPSEYGTAAQRVEYDKLAERARKQRQAIIKATGTETVTAFIPVPQNADRMPHTIKWSCSYSK